VKDALDPVHVGLEIRSRAHEPAQTCGHYYYYYCNNNIIVNIIIYYYYLLLFLEGVLSVAELASARMRPMKPAAIEPFVTRLSTEMMTTATAPIASTRTASHLWRGGEARGRK
jgi:hypothetical protein